MPETPSLFWVFFGLSGRLSPAAFALAGLLVFVAKLFLLYIAPPGLVAEYLTSQAPSPELWSSPAAEAWVMLFSLFSILELWLYFSLAAKRFHDFGKPTAMALIAVPLGSLMILILPFFKGDAGPNRHGERPDAPGAARR